MRSHRYVFYETELEQLRHRRRCLGLILYTLTTTVLSVLLPLLSQKGFALILLFVCPLLPPVALLQIIAEPTVQVLVGGLALGLALTPLAGWFLTEDRQAAGPRLIRVCEILQLLILAAALCIEPFHILALLLPAVFPVLTLRSLRIWQRGRPETEDLRDVSLRAGGGVPSQQKEVLSMDERYSNDQTQAGTPAQAASHAAGPLTPPPAGCGPGYAAPPVDFSPAFYPKRRAKGRDLVLAGLLLAFCFLFWDSVCWAAGLGVGEALGLAALLPAALWYLRGRPGKQGVYGLACAGLYLLGALSLIFSGDASLKILTVFALAPLFLIVILERLGLRTGLGLRQRLWDLGYLLFGMGFGRINVGAWALSHAGEEDSVRSRRRTAILLGLLCAIPALLILMPLLISSDAAFAGLMGKLDMRVLGRFLLAMVLAGLLALLLFTLLFSSDRGPKALSGGPRRGVEPAAVIAFLAAVGAAYVLYLIAQFAYFTDAFRGLLPKDFTVAEYARRGFFEMCAIVAINLVLIVLAVGLCRKEGGKLPGAVKALALFLCAFSLALVATAISKMVLYMHSLGLTRLRLLTSAFMIFLAAVVLAVALRLFVRRVPVVQLAVSLGAAILIVLSLVNVDGLVARYNVDAWRTGKLDSLDVETVCMLGDGAVPVLTELAKDGDPTVSAAAEKELTERLVSFGLAKWQRVQDSSVLVPGDGGGIDLRSWNLISARAYEALCAYNDG